MGLEAPLLPIATMLGIQSGSKVCLIRPPESLFERLGALPLGVEILETAKTGLDIILFFPMDAPELSVKFASLVQAITAHGSIWVFWPPAEELSTHLSEAFIRRIGIEAGLVDDKILVLDSRLVGLRLGWRRRPRLERPQNQAVV